MHHNTWRKLRLTMNNRLWIVFSVYIHGQFSPLYTNVLTGFMISLFLAAPAPSVRKAWNLMGASVPNWLKLFLLFAKNYYFQQKLSFLIITLFSKRFSNFRSDRINAAVCETLDAKKVFKLLEKVFSVWNFNFIFTISALFSCFSVRSSFTLMQLISQRWSGNIYVV